MRRIEQTKAFKKDFKRIFKGVYCYDGDELGDVWQSFGDFRIVICD